MNRTKVVFSGSLAWLLLLELQFERLLASRMAMELGRPSSDWTQALCLKNRSNPFKANLVLLISMSLTGKRRLKDLLLQKDNQFCADCNAPDPKWASVNIGVFVCLKCCGVHRSLGAHISKVLSVALDELSTDEIDSMIEVGGNSSANSIYEASIPEGFTKPGPDSSHDLRAKFIRSKYEHQEFLKSSLRIVSGKSNPPSSSSRGTVNDCRSTSGSKNLTRVVEFIGMLKVKVIKGTNLAIRDMMTSDPYVIFKLGQQVSCSQVVDVDNFLSELTLVLQLQTVQTTVVKSNLNPVWNEELMLSVTPQFGLLNLNVFDYDLFSADDIMGEADIDLQPLITSAMSFGDAKMFDDMQIGKWMKSHDNALIDDSAVNIVGGKIKQEMSIKLQNVESGELDLELEWIPLEQ
ncbi:ADP-ribosylation factor GTPase-activating protein AGD12, partial [Mucuna pruriens]